MVKTYNGAVIPWQPVKVNSRRKGTTTWTLHSTLNTNSAGADSFMHKPTSTREYFVRFSGSTACMGDHRPIRTVAVTAERHPTPVAIGATTATAEPVRYLSLAR